MKQFAYAILTFLYNFRKQFNEDNSLENREMESVITEEQDQNDATCLLEKNKQKSVNKKPENVRLEYSFSLTSHNFLHK